MKRIFNFLCLAAIATTVLVACSKDETPVKKQVVVKTITFNASSPDTKSVFGDKETEGYPTIWTADQQVKIAVVNINPVKVADADVTPFTNGRAATFDADFSFEGYEDDDDLEFVSVSPACAVDEVSGFGSMVASVPATQTPTTSSVDQKAHIMGATNTSYTVGTLPSSVKLSFTHQVAYGKFLLKGFPEDVTISSIDLESTEDIVGQFTYPVVPESIIGSLSRGKKLTIVASGISPANNNTTPFWFALLPVNLTGKTLTVTVHTNDGDYVKAITFPSGKGNFEIGKVGAFNIDMTNIRREWTSTINFGSRDTETKITGKSFSANDVEGKNSWNIETETYYSTWEYSNWPGYSMFGDEDEPVKSITFTTELYRTSTITKMYIKLGGTDSADGDVALMVDGVSKKQGSLDGSYDVEIETGTGFSVSGRVLKITITNTDWGNVGGGIKAYNITVTYKN